MYEIYRTRIFIDWLDGLRDDRAVALVDRRLLMLARHEHFGDSKQVARGIVEMRIHFGPGYRVYLTRRGKQIILLLCGGDKRSQKRDIEKAIELAETTEIEQ
jgi:putative addiction module killer protein